MEEQAWTTEYLLTKLNEKFEKWKVGATKSTKASGGKREAPAIPGPAPTPRKVTTLDIYEDEKRKIRAFLGGGSRWDSRR